MFKNKNMRIAVLALAISSLVVGIGCTKKTKVDPCVEASVSVPNDEIEALRSFITSNDIDATFDSRGFYYRVHTLGTEEQKPGQCAAVLIDYTGRLINGSTFETRANTEMNLRNLIPGFRLGMPLFNVGSEYTLYLPPSMGYGNNDNGPIPGGSILIYKIKLNSITQAVK